MNVPNPDGIVSTDPPFNFTRLGVRVPAVVVSPYINAGTVIHSPEEKPEYCHSSIPATLRALFAPNEPFLTKRDAWAATFDELLTRDTPRSDCPQTMPQAPLHRELFDYVPELDGKRPLTGLQKFFIAMAANGIDDDTMTDDVMAKMTEGEGSRYVINAVNKAAGRTIIEPHWGVEASW